MKKSMASLAIAVLSTFVSVPAVRADTVGPAVLTRNGANTDFTLSGVFNTDTPVTPYSGANVPWTLTFTLETTPTHEAFALPDIGIFGIDTTAHLNGISFPNTQVVFFSVAQQGGVTVCLSTECTPDYPPAASFFDIFTVDAENNYLQLYSGDVTAPTFLGGSFLVDGSQSSVGIAPTPEPGSLMLLGTGVLVLGASVRSRYRPQRDALRPRSLLK